jgi:hypothetical protein
MKVFLSSTYQDLVEYRMQAKNALERLGQQVERMEVFGARPEEPQQSCLEEIERCDVFIGIYAHRYGYIPLSSTISITESEFRHAKDLKKPIFCFVVDDNQPWLPSMIEREPGQSKLAILKQEIGTVLVRETFTSPEDLAMKIATALGRYLATLDPIVRDLRGLIHQYSDPSEQKRQAVVDALSAAVEIARATLSYFAYRRRSGQSDPEKEGKLSEGWQHAGLKLAALPYPASELANRYFLKSQYWADPDSWTEERIAKTKIRLDELSEESRAILLAMQSAKLVAEVDRGRDKP